MIASIVVGRGNNQHVATRNRNAQQSRMLGNFIKTYVGLDGAVQRRAKKVSVTR